MSIRQVTMARLAVLTPLRLSEIWSVALNARSSRQVVKDLGGWKSEATMRRGAALMRATLREGAEAERRTGGERRTSMVRSIP